MSCSPSYYIASSSNLTLILLRNKEEEKKRSKTRNQLSKMLKSLGLFGNKKTNRPFKEYYSNWFSRLKNYLLPQLRRAMHESSIAQLSTRVEIIRAHFQSYYEALDLAAADDVAQILYPDWRNPLEKPFLWLGDLHPYLFTNLLRSFLDDEDEEDEIDPFPDLGNRVFSRKINNGSDSDDEIFKRPWHIVTAWRNPSENLMNRIEQIECGVRLMVPALASRSRKAQAGFVGALAEYWGSGGGGGGRRKEAAKMVVGKALAGEMDEMVGVFVDANRLRRSVLTEIIGATSVYQAAMFLEALAQFLVGFRDSDLVSEFERCKMPMEKLT